MMCYLLSDDKTPVFEKSLKGTTFVEIIGLAASSKYYCVLESALIPTDGRIFRECRNSLVTPPFETRIVFQYIRSIMIRDKII